MKLAVQIQLLPDADQATKLLAVMERFNEAANWISGELFVRKLANKIEAQQLLYAKIREQFGLSSQMAILCLHRACEAYKRDKAIRPVFRKHAAITYDVRTMSFKGIGRVSLLTLAGRILIPFVIGQYQAERIGYPKGQADLVLRNDGKWFLLVIVDLPSEAPKPTADFVGVDFGIVNLATDSDGEAYSGEAVEKIRVKHNLQRKALQKKGTRGAIKKLRRVAGKEARFKRHENHVVSKKIVESAKRTGRAIALENLTGIRQRITARGGDTRNRLSGWGFAQLGGFIAYKAAFSGIEVAYVDPRYTSQTCSNCGHRERANRKSQSEFSCQECGMTMNADWNAARNIRAQATRKMALELTDARV